MHGRCGGAPAAPCPIYSLPPPGDLPSPGDLPLPPRHATPGGCRAGVAPKGHPLPAESGFGGDPPAVPPQPGCAFQEGVPGGGRMGNPQAGTGKGLTPDNATFGGAPSPPAPKMFTGFHHHNQRTPGPGVPGGLAAPKSPPLRVPLWGCGLGGTALCPCVHPAAPQRCPSQGAASPGSSLGRGHGGRPTPAYGTTQPERRALPHASRARPQTLSGGTQGVPVPPSPT